MLNYEWIIWNFICFIDDGKRAIVDVYNKSQTEIHDHVKRIFCKSEWVQSFLFFSFLSFFFFFFFVNLSSLEHTNQFYPYNTIVSILEVPVV